MRRHPGLHLAAALAPALLFSTPLARAGTESRTAFSDYSPLSGNSEMARRLLSPLTQAKIPGFLSAGGKSLKEQPVDLANESFLLYVPETVPAAGYGLIVFVPPWRDARLPEGWGDVLERRGIIFVSAENSGNDQNVLGRRIPLALLAEHNVVRRYKVDPSRIYIAGFSGGSRVASRIAIGYPDTFRGAIMDAGADTFGGDGGHPLPPADLMRQFQESSRLVYIAGGNDAVALAMDDASKHSAEEWCAFHADDVSMPFSSHGAADAQALAHALDFLEAPTKDDPAMLADCRSKLDSELTDKVQQVRSLDAAGRRGEAQQLIEDINTRFGGLAAAEIQALAVK